MGSNKINCLNGSQWLHSQVIAIAGEIKTSPMSPKKYELLTRRLDNAFEALQTMETESKTTHLFIRTQAEYLKEQFRELYNELDNALINREIALIQNASDALKGGPSLQAIKKLESHINGLIQKYAPSLEHHRVLSDAMRAIAEAKLKLDGQEISKPLGQTALLHTRHKSDALELIPGDIEELFDIAKALYDVDAKQARRRFAQLPTDYQNRFHAHMKTLEALPFEDKTASIQALIATANDAVGTGQTYPSVQQIEEFFTGLNQVNEEESKEDKIFSFAPRLSSGG